MYKSVSLNEVTIVPSALSSITSRAQCNPYDEEGKLPIFVSPMTCIVDASNIETFYNRGVIPIAPRNTGLLNADKKYWKAVSLKEFTNMIYSGRLAPQDKILIDLANGHMEIIYDLVKKAKSIVPELTVMVGNIANPLTYIECCKAGVDYVRVGIGGGSRCSTSMLTGVHYSHVPILKSIKDIKTNDVLDTFKVYGIKDFYTMNFRTFDEWIKSNPSYRETKIVVDGGINTIDKAIKCLALGADYVMLGGMFAKCKEACGEVQVTSDGKKLRRYYGMASVQGQKDLGGDGTKSPEGIDDYIEVDTSIAQICDKFVAALRSAMSYTDCKSLKEFKTKVTVEEQSIDEWREYYKV